MNEKIGAPHVYTPGSLPLLLSLYRKMPDSLIYAGGTGLLHSQRRSVISLSDRVIYIGRISELREIRRTESYIEIGATAPMEQIVKTLGHHIPQCLMLGIQKIGNPVIRNYATLGGNMANPENWVDLAPVMMILEARIELRSQGAARLIPVGQFLGKDPPLEAGEIIAGFRIPLESWNAFFYRKFNPYHHGGESRISITGIAQITKGIISRSRIAVGIHKGAIIRDRSLENALEGKPYPVPARVCEPLLELFSDSLKRASRSPSSVETLLLTRSLSWMLRRGFLPSSGAITRRRS